MTEKQKVNVGIYTSYLRPHYSQSGNRDDSSYNPSETAGHIISLEYGLNPKADLVIAGCTDDVEYNVRSRMLSGLIVARYSKFHGDASEYTGVMPERSGYSLDIPKHPSWVRKLLSEDTFLEGILERDEMKIREGVDRVNSGEYRSRIIVTPYLTEALSKSWEREEEKEESPVLSLFKKIFGRK